VLFTPNKRPPPGPEGPTARPKSPRRETAFTAPWTISGDAGAHDWKQARTAITETRVVMNTSPPPPTPTAIA
jgi:hypothetical protein